MAVQMDNLIKIISEAVRSGVTGSMKREFSDTMASAHQTDDIIGNAIMQAVGSGNEQAAQKLGDMLMGKEGGQKARGYAAIMGVLGPSPQSAPTNRALYSPTPSPIPAQAPVTPDQLQTAQTEAMIAQANRKPYEFDNPLWEFWIPALIGGRGTAAGLLIGNVADARKAQAAIDKLNQARTANMQWMTDFNTLVKNDIPVTEAKNQLYAKYGFLPPQAAQIEGLTEAERAKAFHRTWFQMLNDPQLIEATIKQNPNMTLADLFKKMMRNSFFSASMQHQGQVPDSLRPLFDRMTGLEVVDYGNEIMATLKRLGNLEPTPENVDKAMRDITKRAGDAAEEQAYRTGLGGERAEQEAFISKLGRRKATVKAEEDARFESTLNKPVSMAVAASMGVPPGTTNEQLYKMNVIPLGKDSQENYIKSALNLLKTMRPVAENLFTAEGFNRFTRGGKLAWEKFEQSNPDLAAWEAMRMSLAFALAKASGERGVLSRQDVQPYLKAIPNTYHSKTFAKAFFDSYEGLLKNNLDLMRQRTRPLDTTTTTPAFEVGKTYNDAKGRGAIYRGKNEKGQDLWEMVKEK